MQPQMGHTFTDPVGNVLAMLHVVCYIGTFKRSLVEKSNI